MVWWLYWTWIWREKIPCDKELYRLNLTNKEGTIEIKGSDNKDNNIGTISFNRDNNGTMINIDINDDRDKIKVSYQSKKTNKKKSKRLGIKWNRYELSK